MPHGRKIIGPYASISKPRAQPSFTNPLYCSLHLCEALFVYEATPIYVFSSITCLHILFINEVQHRIDTLATIKISCLWEELSVRVVLPMPSFNGLDLGRINGSQVRDHYKHIKNAFEEQMKRGKWVPKQGGRPHHCTPALGAEEHAAKLSCFYNLHFAFCIVPIQVHCTERGLLIRWCGERFGVLSHRGCAKHPYVSAEGKDNLIFLNAAKGEIVEMPLFLPHEHPQYYGGPTPGLPVELFDRLLHDARQKVYEKHQRRKALAEEAKHNARASRKAIEAPAVEIDPADESLFVEFQRDQKKRIEEREVNHVDQNLEETEEPPDEDEAEIDPEPWKKFEKRPKIKQDQPPRQAKVVAPKAKSAQHPTARDMIRGKGKIKEPFPRSNVGNGIGVLNDLPPSNLPNVPAGSIQGGLIQFPANRSSLNPVTNPQGVAAAAIPAGIAPVQATENLPALNPIARFGAYQPLLVESRNAARSDHQNNVQRKGKRRRRQ
jgi:hypothetical protein